MSVLGSKLRDARIEKGYTLNTLQQMTKIQKKYLVAIEEGQFSELPGNFYIRAFVKQYADVVGLNGDDLLEEFSNELDVDLESDDLVTIENIETEAVGSRVKSRQQGMEKDRTEVLLSYLPLAFLVAIILMIIFSLVMALMRMNNPTGPTTTQQVSTSIVSTVAPESAAVDTTTTTTSENATNGQLGENQIRVGNKVMTLISNEGEETVYEIDATNFNGFKFGAKGKSFVWVGMLEDDVMVVDTTVSEGESFDYTVENQSVQEFRMRLGYPEGAVFTVNGTELPIDNAYFPDTVVFRLKPDSTNTPAPEETEAQAVEEEMTEAGTNESTEFEGPAVLQNREGSGQ